MVAIILNIFSWENRNSVLIIQLCLRTINIKIIWSNYRVLTLISLIFEIIDTWGLVKRVSTWICMIWLRKYSVII